jgi:WD40 repeat protein
LGNDSLTCRKLYWKTETSHDLTFAIAPDGQSLAIGKGKSITIYAGDGTEGESARLDLQESEWTTSCLVLPHTKSFVVRSVIQHGNDKATELWRVDGTRLYTTKAFDGHSFFLALSEDARTMATMTGGGMVFTDTISGKITKGDSRHPFNASSKDRFGYRYEVQGEMRLQIWDHESKKLIEEQKLLQGSEAHAFSPNFRFLSFLNRNLVIWDISLATVHVRINLPAGLSYHTSYPTMDFSHDGTLLAIKFDNNELVVWNTETGKLLADFPEEIGVRISYMRFLKDGHLVVIAEKLLENNRKEYRMSSLRNLKWTGGKRPITRPPKLELVDLEADEEWEREFLGEHLPVADITDNVELISS